MLLNWGIGGLAALISRCNRVRLPLIPHCVRNDKTLGPADCILLTYCKLDTSTPGSGDACYNSPLARLYTGEYE